MEHVKWLCLLCVTGLVLTPYGASARGDGAPFAPSGEVSLGYWPTDGQLELGAPTWRGQADTDAGLWTVQGEYHFAPRWSGEATVTSGDMSGGPWSAWPIEPGEGESGQTEGDLRMWAMNVYYTVWESPQPTHGTISTLDVGVGYAHSRETAALEHRLPPEVAGIVSTYRYAFEGLQVSARGRVPLSDQADLAGGLSWMRDADLSLDNYYPGGEWPSTSESGDGDGWSADVAVVHAPGPGWQVELGYRYLRHTGSAPRAGITELKTTQKGLYLAVSRAFD